MNADSARDQLPTTTSSHLEAHDLEFRYTPRAPVLDKWSASFRSGSLTALTGPSGKGKSTLLYLLGLMLRPTSGEIVLAGEAVSGLSDASLARLRATKLGFVFQDAALDQTRSVLDNVTETAIYRGQSRTAVTPRALELLDRFEVNVPHLRKPGQVSGGQAQRIALCWALINDPLVLLADEPTGNLDPLTSDLVVRALRAHAENGAAVIVVTHSPEVASVCDREIRL